MITSDFTPEYSRRGVEASAERDEEPEWMTCHAEVFINVWLPRFESGELRREPIKKKNRNQRPSKPVNKRPYVSTTCKVKGCTRYARKGGLCINHHKEQHG